MAKTPNMKTPPLSIGISGAATTQTVPKSLKAAAPKRFSTPSRGQGTVPTAAGGKGKKAY